MKAIIPAAGLGTRFLPITKAVPKEMLPLVDKPIIQWIVEEATSVADEVVIVNSHEKQAIEKHFAEDEKLVDHLRANGKDELALAVEHAGSLNVSYVYQEEALGLGHAVLCASEKIDSEPFIVSLGDVVVPNNQILKKMKEISEEHNKASVIAVMPVKDEEVNRFGIISGIDLGSNVWKVDGMVEKPALEDAPSNLSIFGRYLLSPKVMEILKDTKPGVGGEIQLTDALIELLNYEDMYAYVMSPEDGLDTGTPECWRYANEILNSKKIAI